MFLDTLLALLHIIGTILLIIVLGGLGMLILGGSYDRMKTDLRATRCDDKCRCNCCEPK